MALIGEWLRRLRYLANRARLEAALHEEMEAHRAMMGEPVRFGNLLRLREESRDQWGWRWLDDLVRDLRLAARALRRTPTFAAVAIASLAIGLALTASTVSVVNAYLIQSLPYPEANRLYHVMYAPPGPWEPGGMAALDWQSVADVVEYPIASAGETFYVTGAAGTLAARGLRVSRGFMDGLGVPVTIGRRFMGQDFHGGSEPVALIGHALWRDQLGSDFGVVGKLIQLEAESRGGVAESFRIVGVISPGFYYGRHSAETVDVVTPLVSPVRVYMIRLREGVPPRVAERRITEAARQAATSPLPPDWTGVQLESAHDRYVGQVRPILIGVTAAASLVLVVVCANVAVLLLLRAMQRQKEVAVRLALGAGWRHIGRMLVAETSLICATALVLGLALTTLTLNALAPAIETQLGKPAPRGSSAIAIDDTVLLIVAGITIVVGLALSLAPLMMASGRRLMDALRQDGRVGTDSTSGRRLRSALVAFELAAALVLLVACGLMLRTVMGMIQTDLGFATDGLVRARIVLRASNYAEPAAYRRFYEQFAWQVSAVTGSPVVFTNWPPFTMTPTQLVERELNSGRGTQAGALAVSPEYFSQFGIELRQGREFTAADVLTREDVAIISESLAMRLWPHGGALGQRVRSVVQTQGGSTPGPWRTVIGIAADVRQTYQDVDRNDFYTPMMPETRFGSFYVRSTRPIPLLLEEFRAAAARLDPQAVILEPRPVAEEDRALPAATFLTAFLSGFAAVAVFLATLGMYGVTAYSLRQREKEIAIRVALGASAGAVVRLVLHGGAVLLGTGAAVGLLASMVVSRVLQSQLWGAEAFGVTTYMVACGLLLAAGLFAMWWPARQAARRNPAIALNAN